jgi:hypothetical protein
MRIAPKIGDRELVIAVHEAGHAVACVKLGVPFSSVSIDLAGTGFGAGVTSEVHLFPSAEVRDEGPTRGERDADLTHLLAAYVRRCRKQVIVCFAGRAAEERAARLGLTSGVGVDSDLKDLRDAHYFLRELLVAEAALRRQVDHHRTNVSWPLEMLPARLVEEMAGLKAEAENLVAGHFQCIPAIARTLVTKKRMTRDQVAQLVPAN